MTSGRPSAEIRGCWRVLMDVKVAHRHVFKNEAEADETHNRVYGSGTGKTACGPATVRRFRMARQRAPAHRGGRCRAAARHGRAGRGRTRRRAQARTAIGVKTRSLLVGTPSTVSRRCIHAIDAPDLGSSRRHGIERDLLDVSGSSILPKVRNAICAWFLASDHTDLIFIDADMGWQANAIVHLLASPHPVIGAVGRRKDGRENLVVLSPAARRRRA
jgi:hypothetical protein